VTLEEARHAVEVMENPDPDSSDPDNEGKRIERVPGGWVVLNSAKYREQVTREEARRKTRERVARYREKQRNVTKEALQEGQCNASVTEAVAVAVAQAMKKEQKLSRAKKQREAQSKPPTKTDIAKLRHREFKAAIGLYWKSKNPGVEMPWGAPEGQALEIWLRESPTTTIEQFTGYLRNRFKSDVNHTERPSVWIRKVTNYATESVDRFNIPKSNGGANGNGHYKGKTEQSLDAARDAIEAIENRRPAGDPGYPAAGEVEQRRLPSARG
jgi:hypothetical protein